ncbi:MAG: glycosyltransferase family 9 protein [Marinoscillum sp.]
MQILIVQTAFIGDVVLATPLIEKLHGHFQSPSIDFLLRKGNESLFDGHPKLREVIIWDKNNQKWSGLFKIIRKIRRKKYDLVINLHRYLSSGILTALSGSEQKVGFRSNPMSLFFDRSVHHRIYGRHEVERNLELIKYIMDDNFVRPKLYVDKALDSVKQFKAKPYITISPGSTWVTKKLPEYKWVELIEASVQRVYLLGSRDEVSLCEQIKSAASNTNVTVLAGQLTMLSSCALMADAEMNYVNDSAPLHFASAVNAPVTAVFCSTIPEFGFGPLSDNSFILQTSENLTCRPCGLHGKKHCPKGHFKCGHTVILVD